jgi:signal transduction histidine kinase
MSERLPRLLVVDDEQANLRALCDTLGTSGYETCGCPNAQEALETLRRERFDLLLTDLHMPGMDGIALLQAARELDPSLAGVIMTGGGSISTAVAAMQSGALDYILKPFKLSIGLPVLARALQVKRLRDENAALTARVQRQVEALSQANQDLEAFSSSVSHDLRAPLQVVDGFSAVLAAKHASGLDAKGLAYLGRIRGAIADMHALIDGLLRLAHVARQPLEQRPVDLALQARAAVRDLAAAGLVQEGWITIDALPPAHGDAALLRQVFTNLISNACKFSANEPQPRVHVGSRLHEGQVAWFVQDNGAGFDMAHAKDLFEPFRRLHKVQEFAGIGIGLSIVQRIVRRHGGRIWAHGEVGQGACFSFTLGAGSWSVAVKRSPT